MKNKKKFEVVYKQTSKKKHKEKLKARDRFLAELNQRYSFVLAQ